MIKQFSLAAISIALTATSSLAATNITWWHGMAGRNGEVINEVAQKFNAAFDEFRTCDGVVVLSDLPGGSPFKTAVECKYARPDQKIEVIAGTNLPMIVTAVTMLDMEDDPRALAEELVDTGKDCMVIFELQAPAEEAESDESDGI